MFKSAWNHLVKDYKDIPLGVKLLVLIIALRAFGWGFADPFFSLYLNQFTPDFALIGTLSSIMAFTALITIIPLMKITDKIQERVLIQDGEVLYLLVVFGYVLSGYFLSLPLLIFTLAVNGVAQTFVVVGTEAYIRKADGGGKSGPFGFYVAMDYLGWIIGMLIAAFTVAYYGLNTMFLFILPSIFLAFLILPRIHEEGLKSFVTGIRSYFHTRQDFVDLFSDFKALNPKTAFFLVLAFFDGVIRMFAYIFIPLFAVSLKLDLKAIAILSVVMYLPFIFSYFFSELSDTFNKMRMIAIGLFIGALSFVLLHFVVSQWWVIFFAALISLSMAIIRPAYNGALTRLTPRSKLGEITSIYNFVDRIGRIVGPILTGLIADHYGLKITFLVIAVSALALGLLSLSLRGYDIPDAYEVETV
jgi:MFS family permease